MKAILIEDEESAVSNLKHQLTVLQSDIQIIEVIDTVTEAIDFFKQKKDYDLVFMDIHLADGNSFEIVKEVEPDAPIIFTTAYDQYAIRAFKLNSIDYLLKPIREQELENAIHKFKERHNQPRFSFDQMEALLSIVQQKKKVFRSSFLIQQGETFIPIPTDEFAFFFIKNGVVRGTTKENLSYHLNEKLEDLEKDLNPNVFFRANRQYLIQRSAIKNLQSYFNGRLIVNTQPKAKEQIIVSKANATKLKTWLNLPGKR